MPSAVSVIQAFWSALADRDVPRARALVADHALLRAAGVLARGGAGFGLSLAAMMLGAREPLRIVYAGDHRIILERTARLGPQHARHPVLALVTVHGCRITSWVEYYDEQLVAAEEPPAEPLDVLPEERLKPLRVLGRVWERWSVR